MEKNLLEKYITWVDSKGWKTFFKVYGLATLYSLIMCIFKSDEWGICSFYFLANPLVMFIGPMLTFIDLFMSTLFFDDNYLIGFLFISILLVLLINFYRFSKQGSSFRIKAKKISQAVKLGLSSYMVIVLAFYLGVLITGYDCSFDTCGALRGYR